MGKVKSRFSILTVVWGFVLILTGCGNTSTSHTVDVGNIRWNVAAYTVVPFDSVNIEVVDIEAFNDVLPLRCSYKMTERAKVDELLEQNNSLLSSKGYVYRWVRYGDPEKMDLVITPLTPLLQQEVEVTEINSIPEYGDNLQVAFRFNDKKQWEEITRANIGKRIAISVNGTVLNAPKVNMAISGGACSVTVPSEDASELLPDVNLSKFKK